MSTTTSCAPLTPLTVEASSSSDDQVRRQVWSVLAGLFPQGRTTERRADQRFAYPQLLYLTPMAEDGSPRTDESVVVVGKHLSERGLGFFYREPLPERRMIASLQLAEGRWAGFIIDITWCRFTHFGWYDSGGRLLQAVPSPMPPVRQPAHAGADR